MLGETLRNWNFKNICVVYADYVKGEAIIFCYFQNTEPNITVYKILIFGNNLIHHINMGKIAKTNNWF